MYIYLQVLRQRIEALDPLVLYCLPLHTNLSISSEMIEAACQKGIDVIGGKKAK